jgi:hypothetical protein
MAQIVETGSQQGCLASLQQAFKNFTESPTTKKVANVAGHILAFLGPLGGIAGGASLAGFCATPIGLAITIGVITAIALVILAGALMNYGETH